LRGLPTFLTVEKDLSRFFWFYGFSFSAEPYVIPKEDVQKIMPKKTIISVMAVEEFTRSEPLNQNTCSSGFAFPLSPQFGSSGSVTSIENFNLRFNHEY